MRAYLFPAFGHSAKPTVLGRFLFVKFWLMKTKLEIGTVVVRELCGFGANTSEREIDKVSKLWAWCGTDKFRRESDENGVLFKMNSEKWSMVRWFVKKKDEDFAPMKSVFETFAPPSKRRD